MLTDPAKFRLAVTAGLIGRPFAPSSMPSASRAWRRCCGSRPPGKPAPPVERTGKVHPAQGERRGRVALLSGCINPVLAPSTDEAAIRVLNRHGIEVVVAEGEACCGTLSHHMGREADALAFARNNIDAWTREIDGEGLDAILITVSGCGTMIKDYGYVFRGEAAYADKAARVAALAKDVSEYLAGLALAPVRDVHGLVVAYHSACSLQHGQQIKREPKELLATCGFTVRDVPEAHLCCGSAGTYNILQPAIARRLQARKVANIEERCAASIAAGNIGCITQIGARHRRSHRAHGRAHRLGDRRAAAGAVDETGGALGRRRASRRIAVNASLTTSRVIP